MSSTWTSQAVPHLSTNHALSRLTSEFGRDPVHSTRYGRWRQPVINLVYQSTNALPAKFEGKGEKANTRQRNKAWEVERKRCCIEGEHDNGMTHSMARGPVLITLKSNWQLHACRLPQEKLCCGRLHRSLLRLYRPQSAVSCSTL